MSGYLRRGAANTARKIEATVVHQFVTERNLNEVIREQDPFGLAHACTSAGGHQPISMGDAIVCFHCSRIFTP